MEELARPLLAEIGRVTDDSAFAGGWEVTAEESRPPNVTYD